MKPAPAPQSPAIHAFKTPEAQALVQRLVHLVRNPTGILPVPTQAALQH